MQPKTLKKLDKLANYVAYLISNQNNKKSTWRWFKHMLTQKLKRTSYYMNKDGSYNLNYRNPKDKYGLLTLTNIQPAGKIDNPHISDPVTLNSKPVSGHTGSYDNSASGIDLSVSYSVARGKTTSKEESFSLGFQQAFTSTTTIGNDATAVKQELSATLGFDQSTTDTKGSEDRQDDTSNYELTVPAGESATVTAGWTVGTVKQTITGNTNLNMSIQIGKHWDGKWSGSNKWDTIEELLQVLKGFAADNQDLGKVFRGNPVPASKLKNLQMFSNLPFTQNLTYDNASSIKVVAKTNNNVTIPVTKQP